MDKFFADFLHADWVKMEDLVAGFSTEALCVWSHRRQWAYEELQRRVLDHDPEIRLPALLERWTRLVAVGAFPPPDSGPGRRRKDAKDLRIKVVMEALMRHHGLTFDKAAEEVAGVVKSEPDTVRTAYGRALKVKPHLLKKHPLIVHMDGCRSASDDSA